MNGSDTEDKQANQLPEETGMSGLISSRFLANVSHEIRSRMDAIIGFSQVLAERELTDEQQQYVGIIQNNARDLLKLIKDILHLSQIEGGKLDIKITDYSLERSFAVLESLMLPLAGEKGLQFEIIQDGQLPAQILTDSFCLHKCLVNLVSNAVKFTKEGHVFVKVYLQEVNDKPYILFDVEDTGTGIPADRQESIFEPFMHADNVATLRFDGTGLGLVIAKKLALLLGGELTLTSEVNKGSVFSLTIPAGLDVKSQPLLEKYVPVTELGQGENALDTAGRDKFSGHVLVAEDDRASQMLIKLLLERLGLQVTVAEDGKEVVDKALSQSFDLIFMDIQMPNMDGYEATKALREKGLETPIIAVTAYAMKGDDEKCLAAGCSDYKTKPIDRKILLEVISKYLPAGNEDLNDKIDIKKCIGEKR
jgi:CheY-like chemotaxis protein